MSTSMSCRRCGKTGWILYLYRKLVKIFCRVDPLVGIKTLSSNSTWSCCSDFVDPDLLYLSRGFALHDHKTAAIPPSIASLSQRGRKSEFPREKCSSYLGNSKLFWKITHRVLMMILCQIGCPTCNKVSYPADCIEQENNGNPVEKGSSDVA